MKSIRNKNFFIAFSTSTEIYHSLKFYISSLKLPKEPYPFVLNAKLLHLHLGLPFELYDIFCLDFIPTLIYT